MGEELMNNRRIIVGLDGKEIYITDMLDSLFSAKKPEYVSDEEIPFCDMDCSGCCVCDEIEDYDICVDEEDDDDTCWGIPLIRRVVFNNPATIIFWEDNTKTIVKCMEGEKFEKYAGFIAACAKKMFGSTSRAKAIMNELAVEQPKVEKKPKNKVYVPDLTQAYNEVVANHEATQEAVNEALTR